MSKHRRKLVADAWGALLQAHAAALPDIERRVRLKAGLPLTWYDVLLELAAAPGGRLQMSVLAGQAVLSRSRISRVVDELAAAGLACKEANPVDGRSSYAVITDLGRARFRNTAPVYLAAIESCFAEHLSDTDLVWLRDLLLRARETEHGGHRPPRGENSGQPGGTGLEPTAGG